MAGSAVLMIFVALSVGPLGCQAVLERTGDQVSERTDDQDARSRATIIDMMLRVGRYSSDERTPIPEKVTDEYFILAVNAAAVLGKFWDITDKTYPFGERNEDIETRLLPILSFSETTPKTGEDIAIGIEKVKGNISDIKMADLKSLLWGKEPNISSEDALRKIVREGFCVGYFSEYPFLFGALLDDLTVDNVGPLPPLIQVVMQLLGAELVAASAAPEMSAAAAL